MYQNLNIMLNFRVRCMKGLGFEVETSHSYDPIPANGILQTTYETYVKRTANVLPLAAGLTVSTMTGTDDRYLGSQHHPLTIPVPRCTIADQGDDAEEDSCSLQVLYLCFNCAPVPFRGYRVLVADRRIRVLVLVLVVVVVLAVASCGRGTHSAERPTGRSGRNPRNSGRHRNM